MNLTFSHRQVLENLAPRGGAEIPKRYAAQTYYFGNPPIIVQKWFLCQMEQQGLIEKIPEDDFVQESWRRTKLGETSLAEAKANEEAPANGK